MTVGEGTKHEGGAWFCEVRPGYMPNCRCSMLLLGDVAGSCVSVCAHPLAGLLHGLVSCGIQPDGMHTHMPLTKQKRTSEGTPQGHKTKVTGRSTIAAKAQVNSSLLLGATPRRHINASSSSGQSRSDNPITQITQGTASSQQSGHNQQPSTNQRSQTKPPTLASFLWYSLDLIALALFALISW